jgi:hypothetical protein
MAFSGLKIPLEKWDFESPVPSFLRRVREDQKVLSL